MQDEEAGLSIVLNPSLLFQHPSLNMNQLALSKLLNNTFSFDVRLENSGGKIFKVNVNLCGALIITPFNDLI